MSERIVVVGWDGATWDVILPLVEAGHLPTLGRLLAEGAWARLRSVTPPLSPPAWTSFMTGANPGKTRIFDFVGRGEDRAFHLVNGSWRALPSLWHILSQAGYRVAVMNVPMTYPPEQVNGVLIAGMDAPIKHRATGYPPDIHHRLEQAGLRYRVDVHHSRLLRQNPATFFTTYLHEVNQVTREHGRVARWLWEEYRPDFLMAVFVNTDRIGHAAGRRLKDFAREGAAAHLTADHPIVAAYRAADEALADLLAVLPDDVTLILMSDHGFQPYDRVFNLNYWLKEQGWLALNERALRPSRLGPLAPLWQRLQYRLSGRGQRNLLARAPFFRAVDWQRTRAYSLGAFGSIFINLQGRDPHGIVPPDRYDATCDELAERLLALRDPETGAAIVRGVRRGRDVFHGPFADLGPDLLLDLAPGYFVRNALDEYRPALVYPAGRYGNRSLEHTGMHHPDGILLMRGPRVTARGEQPRAHILDLMPTILALYGLPVPAYVDGQALTGWLDAGVTVDVAAASPGEDVAEGEAGYTAEEEALISEHLRELGYL